MSLADEGLRLALQDVLQRPVRSIGRRTHPYGSSHAIEDVAVRFDDGPPLELVFKDVLAPAALADAATPARLRDPERELEAYRDVLGPAGLDVACCYGAIAEPGRRWLILEAVRGVPLWQVAEDAAWDEAARWLARLHARPVPAAGGRLLSYDEAVLHGSLEHALAMTPAGALDGVAAIWERVVARLAAWPASIVHGDYHPTNILVEHRERPAPRIRPLDWELAGIGPGLLDLTALTSGAWGAAERERIALAYQRALPPTLRPPADDLLDDLAHCRLFVAVRSLGRPAECSPPAEHARDWLTEATALARELAP